MNCRKIKELIPAYLDQELEDDQRSLVEAHLQTCLSCREDVIAMESAWEMLGELPEIEPNPHYMTRFWSKVSDQSPWYQKAMQQTRGILFQKQWVPALAAACAILILVGITMYGQFQIPEADSMVAKLSEVDLDMVEYIDIIENFDIIHDFDFFSDIEFIENLDELEAS